MEKLEQLDNDRSVNLMIVSDHGMIEVSPSKKVILDNYIDVNKIEVISYSPALMFNVKEGAVKSDIYSSLKAGEQNYRIYSKEDIPERFHLKNNIRTPDFLMIAEEGYTINSDEYFKSRGEEYPSGGAHGFDNANIKMDALFIAYGPAFKNKCTMGRIENIHLYEVMAKILNVHPAPNDGDFNTVKEMLK